MNKATNHSNSSSFNTPTDAATTIATTAASAKVTTFKNESMSRPSSTSQQTGEEAQSSSSSLLSSTTPGVASPPSPSPSSSTPTPPPVRLYNGHLTMLLKCQIGNSLGYDGTSIQKNLNSIQFDLIHTMNLLLTTIISKFSDDAAVDIVDSVDRVDKHVNTGGGDEVLSHGQRMLRGYNPTQKLTNMDGIVAKKKKNNNDDNSVNHDFVMAGNHRKSIQSYQIHRQNKVEMMSSQSLTIRSLNDIDCPPDIPRSNNITNCQDVNLELILHLLNESNVALMKHHIESKLIQSMKHGFNLPPTTEIGYVRYGSVTSFHSTSNGNTIVVAAEEDPNEGFIGSINYSDVNHDRMDGKPASGVTSGVGNVPGIVAKLGNDDDDNDDGIFVSTVIPTTTTSSSSIYDVQDSKAPNAILFAILILSLLSVITIVIGMISHNRRRRRQQQSQQNQIYIRRRRSSRYSWMFGSELDLSLTGNNSESNLTNISCSSNYSSSNSNNKNDDNNNNSINNNDDDNSNNNVVYEDDDDMSIDMDLFFTFPINSPGGERIFSPKSSNQSKHNSKQMNTISSFEDASEDSLEKDEEDSSEEDEEDSSEEDKDDSSEEDKDDSSDEDKEDTSSVSSRESNGSSDVNSSFSFESVGFE